MAISTVSDPSGTGRVDMLTGPVAAARAVVAAGAWVKSKHDMYLIRGSVGASALFLPIRRRMKKRKKKKRGSYLTYATFIRELALCPGITLKDARLVVTNRDVIFF